MDNGKITEEMLWSFIDGHCTADEAETVKAAIETDSHTHQLYLQLLQIRQMLSDAELEQPSMRFTRNVMDNITSLHISPATRNYLDRRVIWGIGSFLVILFLAFLIYGLSRISWTAASQNDILAEMKWEIDYSGIFSNSYVNIFMMVNVVLGLYLLDRFLSSGRKAGMKRR